MGSDALVGKVKAENYMASDAAERSRAESGLPGALPAVDPVGIRESAKAPVASGAVVDLADGQVLDGPVLDLRGDAQIIDLVPEAERGPVVRHDLPDAEVKLKRAFDVVFAAGALGVAAIPMAVLAVAIRVASPGPSLFRQVRVGKDGRHFTCLKFRTMRGDADEILRAMLEADPELAAEFEAGYKLRNDPRITSFGGVLRRTSVDELPQLINVLRGEMSVIGPRPLQPDETVRYGTAIDNVLSVRPGLTGLWQVSGRNDLGYEERVEIDNRYATTWRLIDDLKILLRTIPTLAFPARNGAY